jgi:hypothetical protein
MNLTKGQGLLDKTILIGKNPCKNGDEMPPREAHLKKKKKTLNLWDI